MDRRAFLSSGVAVVLAGCSSNGTQGTTNAATAPASATTNDVSPTTADVSTTNEPSTAADDGTTQPAAQSVDVSVDASWETKGEKLNVTVSNDSAGKVAAIDLLLRWYDNKRRYLGSTSKQLLALGGGKKWETFAKPSTPYDERKFDAIATGRKLPGVIPDGFTMELLDSNANGIEGRLHNETGSEQDVTLLGMGYDGDYIGYTGTAQASRIPSNNVWRYKVPLARSTPRYIEMDDAQVVVLV